MKKILIPFLAIMLFALPLVFAAPGPVCGEYINESVNLTVGVGLCNDTGLIVNASNIIIDCKGETIEGNATTATAGIIITNFSNVTIQNCVVVGFLDGIGISGAIQNQILHNTVYNCDDGISVEEADFNVVHGNTAYNNSDDGIYIFDVGYSEFTNNILYDNPWGIDTDEVHDSYFTSNDIRGSTEEGIEIYYSDNNHVSNNVIYNTVGLDGIYLLDSTGNEFSNNVYYNNSGDDFYVSCFDYDNLSYIMDHEYFLNPAGFGMDSFENYTDLSVQDVVDANDEYYFAWSPPIAFPNAFLNKFIDIDIDSGSTSIDEIVWTWTSSESAGWNENSFAIWECIPDEGGSNCFEQNATLNTGANTLTLQWFMPDSVFVIAGDETNIVPFVPSIDCPVNSTTGICQLMQESGAGLGSFMEYLGPPLAVLLIIFVVLGIVSVIGFAVVAAIKGRML